MSQNMLTRTFVAMASLSIVFGLSGCASAHGSSGLGADDWSCNYQPTYNRDWHDDVLCSNGTEQQRPYLREWDSFVTESEIMESAREFEQALNGE